uniref:C-factor-like n=1 Tax=Gadus morhua TaxID=8049 RepID=A0A8C5AMP5_GADMO
MASVTTRTVLITGANRGLGLEMVKQMVEGPSNPEKYIELQALAKSHPDAITCAERVGSLVGPGGLNLLINNAAVLFHVSCPFFLVNASLTYFSLCNISFSLTLVVIIMKELLPHLRAAALASRTPGMSCSKAVVVNLSSMAGSMTGTPESYSRFPVMSYRISKAALNMLTICSALEFQKDNILSVLLHPGWVRTDMGGKEADIDKLESVGGLLSVIDSLTEKHNGAILDYNGVSLPW